MAINKPKRAGKVQDDEIQTGTPVAGYFELGELMIELEPHPWGAFRGISS